jgi:hypothetical protein
MITSNECWPVSMSFSSSLKGWGFLAIIIGNYPLRGTEIIA